MFAPETQSTLIQQALIDLMLSKAFELILHVLWRAWQRRRENRKLQPSRRSGARDQKVAHKLIVLIVTEVDVQYDVPEADG